MVLARLGGRHAHLADDAPASSSTDPNTRHSWPSHSTARTSWAIVPVLGDVEVLGPGAHDDRLALLEPGLQPCGHREAALAHDDRRCRPRW